MRILMTGPSGFIGNNLLNKILKQDFQVNLAVRKFLDIYNEGTEQFLINSISKKMIWKKLLLDCDVVIHIAARVHVMNEITTNPLECFREVNTYGTLNLAQQAADAGVKRFIFISSIKVNGESTELGNPFKADDNFVPTDPYGLSKYEAEVGLREIAEKTGMEVVIIRPPLVYGPNVKANFASMMKWVNKGVPLPLGAITQNKRSLVSIYNLIDLIITCIEHPNAANQTFLVSDNEVVSTTGLLKNMALALNVPSRLLPIPVSWFTLASKLIGKPAISERLCGSLQVDISKTKELLSWTPPYSSKESLKKTADSFLKTLN